MDITMCKGDECKLKDTCLRFKGKTNELYQSYFTEMLYDGNTNTCDYYIEYIPKKVLVKVYTKERLPDKIGYYYCKEFDSVVKSIIEFIPHNQDYINKFKNVAYWYEEVEN